MVVHELRTLLPVKTPLGKGYAFLVEVENHDYWWTVILENGALVTFSQDRIRVARSYTHRRGLSDKQMRRIVKDKS